MSSARRISSRRRRGQAAGRCLRFAHLQHGGRIADIGDDRQPAETGKHLAQKFDPLAGKIGRLDRQAGDVAARPRETATKPLPTGSAASANTIGIVEVACFAAGTAVPTVTMTSTLSRTNSAAISAIALAASLRPAILDRDGATLDPAELAQPLHKGGGPVAPVRSRARAQEADGRQLARLLRVRRERPSRRAADERDELAPLHSVSLAS